MSICQDAAAQTSWDRWVGQALAIVADREPVRLALLPGDGDDLTAPVNPGHPALRAIERKRDGAS